MEVQGVFDPDLTFQSDLLVEVICYWQRLRGERRAPSHDDIDPMNIPRHLLPHLELVDVVQRTGMLAASVAPRMSLEVALRCRHRSRSGTGAIRG